jgi:cytochrome c oxidase subunit 1
VPRTAVWIARTQLAAVALVVIAAAIGGLALQLELWSPGPLWTRDAYGSMLNVHGLALLAVGAPALAGCFGYVAVVRLVDAKRIPAPALAWIAFALWAIGAIAAAYVAGRGEDAGWTFYTPYSMAEQRSRLPELVGPIALAGAGALYAMHLGTVVVGALRTTTPANLATAALLVMAVGIASLASLVDAIFVARIALEDAAIMGLSAPHSFADGWVTHGTRAAAAILATTTIAGPRGKALASIAIGLGVAWALHPMLLLGLGLIGIWISLAIVNGFARPSVAFVVFGCAPAVATLAVSGLFASSEVHLHDTHFEVGGHHVIGMIVAGAYLAALHAWSEVLGRAPHAIMVWAGAAVANAGLLLHVFAMMYSGLRGMPRRYWDYDPAFVDGHRLAAIGAGVAIAGLLVIAIAWLVGARRQGTT